MVDAAGKTLPKGFDAGDAAGCLPSVKMMKVGSRQPWQLLWRKMEHRIMVLRQCTETDAHARAIRCYV
ncbi:hypothetical protein ACLOJK_022558, partial [Asimina triloba]